MRRPDRSFDGTHPGTIVETPKLVFKSPRASTPRSA
jgi:hypothetical protein